MPNVMINLDGLTYEVPPEVEHYVKNRQVAFDAVSSELKTTKSELQTALGERDAAKAELKIAQDAAKAELKIAQDAASPTAIAKAVKARVELETVALDVLDEDTAKTVPALSNRDLKVAVIKAKLPDLSIATDAKDEYVDAIFDVAKVKRAEGDSGSAQRQAVNHDSLSDKFTQGTDASRKAMIDRMSKAYQAK